MGRCKEMLIIKLFAKIAEELKTKYRSNKTWSSFYCIKLTVFVKIEPTYLEVRSFSVEVNK